MQGATGKLLGGVTVTNRSGRVQWTNWCGPSYMHVGVRLWLLSLKPRLAVGGSVSTPPCTNRGGRPTVQVGPWEAR